MSDSLPTSEDQPYAASSLHALPAYTRSLLKVSVPLTVTLASKKQPVCRILELGPGSIIQFDKSCEEMLDVELNGHRIAEGEPVKIGDKFGIRLTAVTLPGERFKSVGRPATQPRPGE